MADLKLVSQASIEGLKASLFSKDLWTFDDLGYKHHEIISSHAKSLNFKKYTLLWLTDLVKETLWRKRVSVTPQTLNAYISTMRLLDRYLSSLPTVIQNAKSLQRKHMEGFLAHITDRSKQTQSSHISLLLFVYNYKTTNRLR